ncbi:MAG: hypothetical protein M3083_14535 [Actinomycetota bacterium]|nr:hypothetical protein [Actinomycetota bacterium]MDQ6944905.1 hypothetical protein [Actinomycetota bacterium]
MELAPLDHNLTRLREMVGLMSTNLVDLETDAGRTRLDQAPLTGTTATRWREAADRLAGLWQWFTQLNEVLEKATQLRGTRPRLDPAQLAQLDWLINGPSIELSSAGIPLAERGLFGPAETTIRCSPPELLDRMRAAFDQVVGVIGACNEQWTAVEAKLGPLGERLSETQRLADAIGEPHHPELDRVRSQLDQLRQAMLFDPLAVASGGSLDGIATALSAVAEDLRRLAQLHDNLGARVDEARALMDQLRATTAAAAEARVEAQAKVANPSVIDPGPVTLNIDRELERVVAMSSQGDWRAAANVLGQWTTRCRDALAAAQEALAANRAPIAFRDELRGRLDAYRAKAYRLGLLEDPAVAALHARARSVLFTAPTDLAQAEQLVRQYQQALTGPTPREVAK